MADQPRVAWVGDRPDFTSRDRSYVDFPSRLFSIDRNRDKFREAFTRVFPNAPDWYIERSTRNPNDHYVKVTNSFSPHNGDGLGNGIIAAIHVVDALYDSSPNEIVAIDEPELSLHPSAQRNLAALIGQFSQDRQVIVATHSPYFAPIEFLEAGATVARVSSANKATVISQVSKPTTDELLMLLKDRNNPHVFGLDAREVLFLDDDVILVEGQDDVLGYTRVFESLNAPITASFFGWGVGGATKMNIVASLMRDLGMERVFGLLDKGQEQHLKQLSKDFPHYSFACLPAIDIRTKPRRDAKPAVDGLLDEHWNIRREFLPELTVMVEKMAAYFQPRKMKDATTL